MPVLIMGAGTRARPRVTKHFASEIRKMLSALGPASPAFGMAPAFERGRTHSSVRAVPSAYFV